MIRLDAIPIPGLPWIRKADAPGPSTGRVNCVLHSGQLSEHQELEVFLNGELQSGVGEGEQHVFTWQFFQASDEVQIVLLLRGRRMKYWQGCWNEQDAILHAGTLPVQVFFAGQPQPLLEATEVPVSFGALERVSSSLTENGNGKKPRRTIVFERTQQENRGEEGGEAPTEEPRTVLVQDLLVLAASGPTPAGPQEGEAFSEEDQLEEEEESDDVAPWEQGRYGEEEQEQWEEEREPDEEGREGDAVSPWEEGGMTLSEEREGSAALPHMDERELRGIGASGTSVDDVVGEDEPPPPASNYGVGRRLAAFHASPLVSQKTLEALKNLVATMPAKTLIVDVRPKDRPKKKDQGQEEALSKSLLRSVFGAKYWDRVWAIPLIFQVVPPAERVGVSTWCYVVDQPESHPDGIPSLVQKLEEGYSIVVVDSIASYAESRRRAVIGELQQRVADLDVGPLE